MHLLDALNAKGGEGSFAVAPTGPSDALVPVPAGACREADTALSEAISLNATAPGEQLAQLECAMQQEERAAGPKINRSLVPPGTQIYPPLQFNNYTCSGTEHWGRNAGDTLKYVLFHLADNGFLNAKTLASSSVLPEYQRNKGYFTYSLQLSVFAGN